MQNEVIIDSCNVAECEFFGKYNVCKAYVYTPKSCGCDYNPNCYFKQLQRAKAENEKLKNRNKLYRKIIVENQQKYHNRIMILKACIKGEINIDDFKNYAKFQKENKKLKKDIHNIYENCKYCDEFYMDKCNYIKKENNYKQALEDIREFINNSCKGCTAECDCVIDDEYCPNYTIKEKINEVLNNE